MSKLHLTEDNRLIFTDDDGEEFPFPHEFAQPVELSMRWGDPTLTMVVWTPHPSELDVIRTWCQMVHEKWQCSIVMTFKTPRSYEVPGFYLNRGGR